MGKLFGLIFALTFGLMASTGWADEPPFQFELSGQSSLLTPDQIKGLRENLLNKGYPMGAQPISDKNGQQTGVRFVVAKTLPKDVQPLTPLETIPTLGMVLLSAPHDADLAAAVQKYIDNAVAKNDMPENSEAAQQLGMMIKGIRRLAILFQIADIEGLQGGQEAAQKFFQSWGDFAEWAEANNIHLNRFPGHRWRLNDQSVPTLFMPNGQQSWAKLKEQGIDGPDHKMPSTWSYTAKGFVKKGQNPVVDTSPNGSKNATKKSTSNGK